MSALMPIKVGNAILRTVASIFTADKCRRWARSIRCCLCLPCCRDSELARALIASSRCKSSHVRQTLSIKIRSRIGASFHPSSERIWTSFCRTQTFAASWSPNLVNSASSTCAARLPTDSTSSLPLSPLIRGVRTLRQSHLRR